jgi:hypothetical protein
VQQAWEFASEFTANGFAVIGRLARIASLERAVTAGLCAAAQTGSALEVHAAPE